jgi:hypothetical protein
MLNWTDIDGNPADATSFLGHQRYSEALIGNWPNDGVRFGISYQPTCHRRGPYKLLIEVCGGPNHHKWGCFDEADQPVRYFHKLSNAIDEACQIAKVLLAEREKSRP